MWVMQNIAFQKISFFQNVALTAQEMKFSIMDFFSKCDQNVAFLKKLICCTEVYASKKYLFCIYLYPKQFLRQKENCSKK